METSPNLVLSNEVFIAYYTDTELEEIPWLVKRDFGKVDIIEKTYLPLGTKSSISGTDIS